MPQKNRTQLKQFFETGDRPTESQFEDLIDSFHNFIDDGAAGTGTVDTSGTPVANDIARFTDADTLEGRSYTELKSDLSLSSVEDTALSTWAGSANLTTLGTIAAGVWNGTAIEGTAIASTGEAGGTKYLREDGDGTSSWQAIAGGGDFADGGEAGGADRTLGNTDNFDLGFLTNGSNRLQIQNDGNVGINTETPASVLDVSGNLITLGSDSGAFTRSDATQKFFRLSCPHRTNAEEDVLFAQLNSGSGDSTLNLGGSSGSFNAATEINLYTAADTTTTTGTLRATILSNGNFGIGLTDPQDTLEIAGTVLISDETLAGATDYRRAELKVDTNCNLTISTQAGGTGGTPGGIHLVTNSEFRIGDSVDDDQFALIGGNRVQIGDSTSGSTFCTVIGGSATSSNTGVAVGYQSAAAGTTGTAVGYLASASGTQSTSVGRLSDATATQSLAIGALSQATAEGATALGSNGLGNRGGQTGFSRGDNSAVGGDTRTRNHGFIPAKCQTTDTSATTFVDFNDANYPYDIPSDHTLAFSGLVTAQKTDQTENAAWKVQGVIKNDSGTATLIASSVTEIGSDNASAWTLALSADDTNDCLKIALTAEATVNATASLSFVEQASTNFTA